MNVSKKALEAARKRGCQCSNPGCVRETNNFAEVLEAYAAEAVAEAVKAERERCAGIADRDDQSAWGIAREIRTGEQPGWRK